MFGVEAISPAPEGELNFLAHKACAERGITHMECLANLDKLIGKGRFRFIGFPLKFRGGTASPIRAVAVLEACRLSQSLSGRFDEMTDLWTRSATDLTPLRSEKHTSELHSLTRTT